MGAKNREIGIGFLNTVLKPLQCSDAQQRGKQWFGTGRQQLIGNPAGQNPSQGWSKPR